MKQCKTGPFSFGYGISSGAVERVQHNISGKDDSTYNNGNRGLHNVGLFRTHYNTGSN